VIGRLINIQAFEALSSTNLSLDLSTRHRKRFSARNNERSFACESEPYLGSVGDKQSGCNKKKRRRNPCVANHYKEHKEEWLRNDDKLLPRRIVKPKHKSFREKREKENLWPDKGDETKELKKFLEKTTSGLKARRKKKASRTARRRRKGFSATAKGEERRKKNYRTLFFFLAKTIEAKMKHK
jgi:hypothetical protein